MKIAICDDSPQDLRDAKVVLSSFFRDANINVTIDSFTDPAVLLNKVRYVDSLEYDLYVLDILMQKNGIDTAAEIKRLNPESIIIFVTASKEYAVDAFHVRAYDYFLKPLNKREVYRCLNNLMNELKMKPRKIFSFKSMESGLISINVDDIVYVESANRRIVITMNDNTKLSSSSLRTKFLDSVPFDYQKFSFIVCHNSYIVNMNYIKSIQDYLFIMKNGDMIPITKRLFTSVKERYMKYLLGE